MTNGFALATAVKTQSKRNAGQINPQIPQEAKRLHFIVALATLLDFSDLLSLIVTYVRNVFSFGRVFLGRWSMRQKSIRAIDPSIARIFFDPTHFFVARLDVSKAHVRAGIVDRERDFEPDWGRRI